MDVVLVVVEVDVVSFVVATGISKSFRWLFFSTDTDT